MKTSRKIRKLAQTPLKPLPESPKATETRLTSDFRLSPEKRLCPGFDETSIALHSVADREEMGVRVVDNCAEEHQM